MILLHRPVILLVQHWIVSASQHCPAAAQMLPCCLTSQPNLMLHTQAKRGTPCYMAPELFSEGATHSTASDLWSLGCVLYECATGSPPFMDSSFNKLVRDILNKEPALIPGDDIAMLVPQSWPGCAPFVGRCSTAGDCVSMCAQERRAGTAFVTLPCARC